MKVKFEGKNITLSEIRKKEAVLLVGLLNLDMFVDSIDEDCLDDIIKIFDASGIDSISKAMTILSHEIASDSIFYDDEDVEISSAVESKNASNA